MEIYQTNQPGFVNDAPYYVHTRPRHAHVELPCAAMDKHATAFWKIAGDPTGFKARWRREIAEYLERHPECPALNLYDHEGHVLEVFTQPQEHRS